MENGSARSRTHGIRMQFFLFLFFGLGGYSYFILLTCHILFQAFRYRGWDKSFRWFLVRGHPVRDKAGNVTKWFGTFTDIEDQKRAEYEHSCAREAAIEAAQMKDVSAPHHFPCVPLANSDMCGQAFVANISHGNTMCKVVVLQGNTNTSFRFFSPYTEIRTPIHGITGMVSLLLDSALTHEQQDHLLCIQRNDV